LLGEGGPLGVAHDAAAGGIEAGEFASRDEGRFGSAGVASVGGHEIGEVEASGFDFDYDLVGAGVGVGDVLEFEDLGASEAGDDESAHGEIVV